MRRGIWCVILVGLLVAAAVPAAAEVKIGVINVGRLLAETDAGKGISAKLQALQREKQEQAANLNKELQALKERYDKQFLALSEDSRAQLEKEIQDKEVALQRFAEDARRELRRAEGAEMEAFNARVMPIITQVGKELGYTLVFNSEQAGLLYADEAAFITDQVIQRINTTP